MATEKTEIRFREGIDAVTAIPEEARANGLTARTAIIQDSYRADKIDMFFDEALYLRVLEYAKSVSDGGEIVIYNEGPSRRSPSLIGKLFGRFEWTEVRQTLEDFLEEWSAIAPAEREPPLRVVVRNGSVLTMCIATEFWTRVGGPAEYHDSYTYSVFSKIDRGEDIQAFLAASPKAESWSFAAIC